MNNILKNTSQVGIDTTYLHLPDTNINKWYLFTHYNCACNNHEPSRVRDYDCGEELCREVAISSLNGQGNSGLGNFHLVYHKDHSSPYALGASSLDKHQSISISDVALLNNNKFPQIIMSGGCETAEFHRDCIAEHFINNPNYGAVAYMGHANVCYVDEYEEFCYFLQSLYLNNVITLGALFHSSYANNNTRYYSHAPEKYRYHLLGDPEMPVWSDVPQNLNVVVTPSHITTDNNLISVQIRNLPDGESAQLCIMNDADVYFSTTISDTIVHQFSYTPQMPGVLNITVTARNHRPYETVIPVSTNANGYVNIVNITGTDGTAIVGSDNALMITLKNRDAVTAHNVTAILSKTPSVDKT